MKTITNLTKRVLGSRMVGHLYICCRAEVMFICVVKHEDSLLLLNGILIFGCLLLIDCILLSLWAGVNPWQEKEEIRSVIDRVVS